QPEGDAVLAIQDVILSRSLRPHHPARAGPLAGIVRVGLRGSGSEIMLTTMNSTVPMRIEQIFISPGHNFFGHYRQPAGTHPTIEVEEVECVAGKGLAGDRFFPLPTH